MRLERERTAALHLLSQGHSVREVAIRLGIPKSTVHDWWRRAEVKAERLRNPKLRMVARQAAGRIERARLSMTETASVAGVAVLAADTGRLLMLQRSHTDPADPAAGTWEFPGGHLEGDDEQLDGAMREWQEETGAVMPGGDVVGSWRSPDGIYRGFLYRIPSEHDVDINQEHAGREVLNPDDPDGDDIEVAAWWDPDDLPMPAMRDEVAQQWPVVAAILRGTPAVEAAEPMEPERDPTVNEPRKEPKEPPERPPEGEEPAGEEFDTREIGPGEPNLEEEGTNVPRETPPPLIDKLYILAMHRYVNLVANDVPHYSAVRAAAKIDPDFNLTPEQMRAVFHALGKGDEPVKLSDPYSFASNWGAGQVAPPAYVQGVYDKFEFTADQVDGLADYLYELATDSFLEGVNQQLMQLGLPISHAVTDQQVLADLRAETRTIAEGIADTYNRDLSARTYTEWINLVATRGRQTSRYWLMTAIDQWARARAEWKSDQVAITEVGRWWNRGTLTFANRNQGRLVVQRAYAFPDECECEFCISLVLGNPYTLDDANSVNLPAHPGCCHDWRIEYEPAEAGDDLSGLWDGSQGSLPDDIEYDGEGEGAA